MQTFKQFINEAWEDYDKLSDVRKKELIKHHEDIATDHMEKAKEHFKVKPTEKKSLEHSIAGEAHKSAAGLHSHTANALRYKLHGNGGANDFKVQAERMTKGANSRSEIANK